MNIRKPVLRREKLREVSQTFNPFISNGISRPHQLDESTSNLRALG